MSGAVFQQSVPKDGMWKIVGEYDSKRGQIPYVHIETGEQIVVPNVWYNQPVAARVNAMRCYAQWRRNAAKTLRELTHATEYELRQADINDKRAVELDAMGDEMERTGIVTA